MSRKKTENLSSDVGLDIVEQFDTYEDYLDSQLTSTDMYYLEEEDVARHLVELGYRGSGDIIGRQVLNILFSNI
jgi:hypothetical protein